MALFRRGLPKRAVAGAFLGFLYGIIIMPQPGSVALLAGAGWILLSVGLLFGRPVSYYVFVTWALLWVAWKGVLAFRTFQADAPVLGIVLDILVPLLAVALVSASGYVEAVRSEPS